MRHIHLYSNKNKGHKRSKTKYDEVFFLNGYYANRLLRLPVYRPLFISDDCPSESMCTIIHKYSTPSVNLTEGSS